MTAHFHLDWDLMRAYRGRKRFTRGICQLRPQAFLSTRNELGREMLVRLRLGPDFLSRLLHLFEQVYVPVK